MNIKSKGPEGWVEMYDMKTRRTVYYHADLNEIRYTKPNNWVKMLVDRYSNVDGK